MKSLLALRVRTLAVLTTMLMVGLVGVAPANAAPCPWGTQCIAVTMPTPASGAVISGTVPLEATARVTQPARGGIVKVEWWLYHPDFTGRSPRTARARSCSPK
jgi:hypothetical protein